MFPRKVDNLPELFALLVAQEPGLSRRNWGLPRHNRAILLRQLIHLARDGVREYSQRLDIVEEEIRKSTYRGEADRHEVRHDSQTGKEHLAVDHNLPVDDMRSGEPELPSLTERQTRRLFEKLALRHCRLNRRGYPFTDDVIAEQERIYPATQLMARDEVEAAWDDWSDDDAKCLFRRFDREDRQRSGGHSGRNDERMSTRRDRICKIFGMLACEPGALDSDRIPPVENIRRAYRALFPDSDVIRSFEIEEAWVKWINEERGERLKTPRETHDDEGRDEDGRDDEGRDVEGRDDEGRDVEGRDDEGRDVEGRDDEGRDEEGRDDEGRKIDYDGDTQIRFRRRSLTQRQLEAIFDRLCRKGADLDLRGYPFVDEIRAQQRELFNHTRPVSLVEVECSFERWGARWAFQRYSRSGNEYDGDDQSREDIQEIEVGRARVMTLRSKGGASSSSKAPS